MQNTCVLVWQVADFNDSIHSHLLPPHRIRDGIFCLEKCALTRVHFLRVTMILGSRIPHAALPGNGVFCWELLPVNCARCKYQDGVRGLFAMNSSTFWHQVFYTNFAMHPLPSLPRSCTHFALALGANWRDLVVHVSAVCVCSRARAFGSCLFCVN